MHMVPKIQTLDKEVIQNIKTITSVAFSQRRKMLRQSLKTIFQFPESACTAAKIASTIRAENVTVEQYVQLAQHLIALNSAHYNLS